MRAAALGLLAAGTLSSCGYALVGRGTVVDPSIKRIGVPLFRDAGTGKTSLDQKITQKVIEELLKRGRFDVVQQATEVDAVVDGELLSYRSQAAALTGEAGQSAQASRYQIVLTARVKYSKTGATEAIWANDSFSVQDEWDVGEASSFFDREEQAIERLAGVFARNLVAAMMEAF
ncbi:MAG TPA: LPS assembly lipoprotein LptE [Vicinamibacteria bacterium]|nr:LPS assembly lipoprotein LptE [Vicinamibacteria bacterium]